MKMTDILMSMPAQTTPELPDWGGGMGGGYEAERAPNDSAAMTATR